MGSLEAEIQQPRFKSEHNKCIVNLIYTHNFFHQKQLAFFKPYEITIPQFNILRILRGQYPEPATVNLLIERMLDKSSNASRIIDKLESKELVERRQSAADRRAVDVYISSKGLELLARIDEGLGSWEQESNLLSEEECKQLNQLLDRMRG